MTDRKEYPQLIPPHGGYRNLKSYQTAETVYDATVVFCDRFIDKRSRTHDQMGAVYTTSPREAWPPLPRRRPNST
jgi:hypothetical protein